MSYKCIFHSSTVERVSWTPTTLYFAKKIMKITKRTYNISDTRSTEYTHKHFRSYKKLLCEPGCSPLKRKFDVWLTHDVVFSFSRSNNLTALTPEKRLSVHFLFTSYPSGHTTQLLTSLLRQNDDAASFNVIMTTSLRHVPTGMLCIHSYTGDDKQYTHLCRFIEEKSYLAKMSLIFDRFGIYVFHDWKDWILYSCG